jgi:predicted RNase H-like HicB family nuclease
MLTDYVEEAMRRAKYKLLGDGEGIFGEIPGFKGVWANADTLDACREELREVLEDWMLVRVRLGLSLPIIARINLNQRRPRKRKVA